MSSKYKRTGFGGGDATSCLCGHVRRWHRGRCRITGCTCIRFVQATFHQPRDASWMQSGRFMRIGRGIPRSHPSGDTWGNEALEHVEMGA